MTNGSGWYNESRRHALAAQGIETGSKVNPPMPIPTAPKPAEPQYPLFADDKPSSVYGTIKDAISNAKSHRAVDIIDEVKEEYPEVTLDQLRTKISELRRKGYIFEDSDYQLGDLVDFGAYGRLYVVRKDAGLVSEDKLWVTDLEDQRDDRDAPGWFIDAHTAVRVIEKYNDDEDED